MKNLIQCYGIYILKKMEENPLSWLILNSQTFFFTKEFLLDFKIPTEIVSFPASSLAILQCQKVQALVAEQN